jgi:hypothetical protein
MPLIGTKRLEKVVRAGLQATVFIEGMQYYPRLRAFEFVKTLAP